MIATEIQQECHEPEVTRALIDELINTVSAGNAQHRLRVLQRITDLFVAGSRRYSNQQVALFDDVLQQLSAEVEIKARAKLANTLASMDNAPPTLIQVLAFDNAIEVAGPVLTHSPLLTDDDLVKNATTKSQKHLNAIAQRLKLSEAVTDVLVDCGNRQVIHSVARNPGARFSLAGYGKLTARARYDRKLTLTIAERSDIPRQIFLKLLENASAAVRAKLEAANPQVAAAIREAVSDVATAMQHETREASSEFAVAARDAKRRFSAHQITESNVHAPAQAQEFEKTVVALAKLGRFPVDLVERALLDEGEGMVLLLAKAAGCSWITAKQLLLMYAAKRNLSAEDVSHAFERFNRLTPETAQRVVRFHERRVKRRVDEPPPQTNTAKRIAKADASASTAMPNQTARPAPDGARASLETTI